MSDQEPKIAIIIDGDEPAFVFVDERHYAQEVLHAQCEAYNQGYQDGRRDAHPWRRFKLWFRRNRNEMLYWLIFCALCTVCAYFSGGGR